MKTSKLCQQGFKQGTILLLAFLCVFSLSAQTLPSGKTLMDKVDDNMSARSRILTVRMEINSARGVRTVESKFWGEGSKKSFTEYLSPAREKGTKMLKLDNQLWIFSPSTDRVIQLSGHMLRQSVMGSDMSYEDMMTDRPLLEQYKATVSGDELVDGRKTWVVNLTAIVDDVNYQAQKMWVDQERNVPFKVELYAKGGKLLKRMSFSDVQRIQGRWCPKTIVYKDMLKEGKGTTMRILDIQFDATIPASVFNKANLK
jgi:outer membrane lipoprotein-sorting protein